MAEHPRLNTMRPERVLSVHGGISTRTVPYLISEVQAVALTNLIINEVGRRTRRGGAKGFGGAFDTPGGLQGYQTADLDERLIGVWGSRLFTSSGNGAWVQVASGESLVDGLLHDLVSVRNSGNLALAIGAAEQVTEPSQMVIYDITADDGTSVSIGSQCHTSFQNRLWVARDETIYWSELVAPADFSLPTNNLTIEPGLGGNIRAIVGARDLTPKLWVLKENAIMLFEPRWGSNGGFIPDAVTGDGLDPVNSSVRILSIDVGCVATRSAVWVPGAAFSDLFFLARDGVRSLRRAENDTQGGAGFPLTYNIPDVINRINYTVAPKTAAAAVFDNAYHLALPLDGAETNTHILRGDVREDGTISWSLFDWKPRDLRPLQLGAEQRLFFQNGFRAGDSGVTGADTGASGPYQVYQAFSGNADPSDAHIHWEEQSRAFIFQDPDMPKAWEEHALYASSRDTSLVTIAYRVDNGAWTDLEDDIIEGGSDSIILGETPLPWTFGPDAISRRVADLRDIQSGRQLQIRLSSTTGSTDIGKPTFYLQQVRAAPKAAGFSDG